MDYQNFPAGVTNPSFAKCGLGQSVTRILKDLIITEVSSVDRGAGEGVRVMLMKRDAQGNPNGEIDMTKEELEALIKKSAEDAVKTATSANAVELAKRDREITILKMSPTHKAFYDDLKEEDSKKAFEAMDEKGRDAECDKVKKSLQLDPAVAELAKSLTTTQAENENLRKRLDAVDLEKAQTSFKKQASDLGATADGDGDLMRKAYSGDKEAQTAWTARLVEVNKALKAQADTGGLFSTFGSSQPGAANGNAYQTLMTKAEELRKADSKLSPQQAFTKVYTDPANTKLVAAYKSEEARGQAQVVA